ncbi:RE1 [Symbiodinium sp. CCMP2592]|nr:RE1 [Symbiodinium sp. CCMP2592]
MDTVPRRRRSAGSSEPETSGVNQEQLYQTALGQANQEMTPSGIMLSGEASPGMMESGGIPSSVAAVPLPEAHPFYSSRAKAEVQLARSRPSTLDDDGRRLQSEVNETALGDPGFSSGQEPNYGSLEEFQGAAEVPRVARVESGVERPVDEYVERKEAAIGGGTSVQGTQGEEGAAPPGIVQGRVAQLPAVGTPFGEDSRELIPAEASRVERLESLLLEVVEENKSLKRRLQTESNSSWETGVTRQAHGEHGFPASPASFGQGQQFLLADSSSSAVVCGNWLAQAKGVTEESGPGSESVSNTAGAAVASASSGTGVSQEALLAEAAKLLKGVSLKPIRIDNPELDLTWLRSALTSASDPSFCLVDSGATNALRPACDQELQGCRVIHVDLASGGTDLRVNECGTLLHAGQCQVILPANYLIELGFSISWKKKGCKIRRPKTGVLDVQVVKGCPLIPRDVGLRLLQEYEERVTQGRGMRKLGFEDVPSGLTKESVRGWLRDQLSGGLAGSLTDTIQVAFLRVFLPHLPLELLARACVSIEPSCLTDQLPTLWNRRLRRSIERGAPESEGLRSFGRVLRVPSSERGLGSKEAFSQLLVWAASGVFGGLVAGPDLSSFRGSTNEEWTEFLVWNLRFLLLVGVAQAAKDLKVTSEGMNSDCGLDEVPSDIRDPRELVEWALARAAAKLGQQRPEPGRTAVALAEPVFVAWEQPVSGSLPQEGTGLPSVDFHVGDLPAVYGWNRVVCDFRLYGSAGGVTQLWTSSWFLYEGLGGDSQSGPLETRLDEVAERRVLLRKLTESERYALHVARDHSTYLKGCPVCIQAQGRRRSHWRSSFPSVHSASFDLAGPFIAGQSFDPVASGRDKGGGYRYFLTCSYAVPTGYVPLEVEAPDTKSGGAQQLEVDAGLGEPELFPELFGSSDDVVLSAVSHRVRGKKPEVEVEGGVGPIDCGDGFSMAAGKNLTLFLGVPLRTKGGREVLGQIQALINKLEAFGLPVQRFHADRAQELRSKALVLWLRDKGIHTSWTPGEAPAGNHAELAVQNLKGGVRRLLLTAGLPKTFWPLALLHASTRNWHVFAEALGVLQPVMLPFGAPVEARKRTQTGYAAQWQARTVRGTYVGHAPNTPGGHLVLVDDEGVKKVLLTSTVFPLAKGCAGPPKPRFRLKGKRSSFATRVVAASPLGPLSLLRCDARFAPGGESFLDSDFWFEPEEDPIDPTGSDFEDRSVVRVSCFEGSDEESGGEGSFPGCDGVIMSGIEAKAGRFEDWVQTLLVDGEFTDVECLEVLRKVAEVLPVTRRPVAAEGSRAGLLGLYAVGGFQGVSNLARQLPLVTRYLNRFMEYQGLGCAWTTVYVSHNSYMSLHRDLRNAPEFPIFVKAIGEFKGGGLWLEDVDGASCRTLPNGLKIAGTVHDLRKGPVVFSGQRWHASEDWQGDRWILSAFVPREYRSAIVDCGEELRGLGFPLDRLVEPEPTASLRKEVVPVEVGNDEIVIEAWDVDVPSPVLGEDEYLDWVGCHGQVARLCKVLADELCDVQGDPESFSSLAEQLWCAESQRDWLEQVLCSCRLDEDLLGSIRALNVEVPLAESSEHGNDQFLQTRNVSLLEARKELGKWRDPAKDEVVSLEDTNRAVDRVTVADVDRWIKEGISVVQLPGKAVLTRKAGTGKRRCRAVCCGNYLPTEKLGLTREELYASGAESLSVKVAVVFAAMHPSWIGVTIDVKSAFLYAPIRTENQGLEERIIVRPPHFLVELGILTSEHRWWIRKALYGLPTSPRDWGRYRDGEFRKLRIPHAGGEYHLVQLKSDDALWVLRRNTEDGLGDVAGILAVYVDDLALFAEQGLAQSFIQVVQTLWKTSDPEWIGESAVTFCGMEVSRSPTGYKLSQVAYIRELLQRYNVTEDAAVPITKWTDPELPESVTPEEVKEAQAITGALLWVSTRTRPDISYAVSRCGQMATKVPQLSISVGMQTLKYLRSTAEFAMEVPFEVGSPFADHGLLSIPRSPKVLEVYTDASHSPGGDRSMQSLVIVWQGVPIAWETTRQAFTTLSSAEAELVCMIHGTQLSECIQSLLDELLEEDSLVSLLCDNQAALRSFDTVSTGWRSRHLRMRAISGRERVEAGILRVSHIPGTLQVADIGTKPLGRSRILQLLSLIGIGGAKTSDSEAASARVLSRGVYDELSTTTIASAKVLAGLTLLALIPRAKGQPDQQGLQEGYNWLLWTVAWVVTGVCVLCSGWLWVGEGRWRLLQGLLERVRGVETSGIQGDGEPIVDAAESDDFTDEEWRVAQMKLEESERRSGLTLVQRARVRKQVAAGGVVDVPSFLQRFGPEPSWFTGVEANDPSAASEDPLEPPAAPVAAASSSDGPLEPLVANVAVDLLPEGPPETPVAGSPAVLPDESPLGVRGLERPRVGLWDLVNLCTRHGDLLAELLGIRERAWIRLSWAAVALLRHPMLGLLVQLFDTGMNQSAFEGQDWEVELRAVPGEQGIQWVPRFMRPRVEESSRDRGDFGPLDSEVQFRGSPRGSSSGIPGPLDSEVQFRGSPFAHQLGCSDGAIEAPDLDVPAAHSSSSHGMGVPAFEETGHYYEDLFPTEGYMDSWPLVGSWIQVHYVMQLCSTAGDTILWFLGLHCAEWFRLLRTSGGVRVAVVGAVAEVLRRGPRALAYEGHGWFEAVSHWMVHGDPVGQDPEADAVDAGDAYLQNPHAIEPFAEEVDIDDDPGLDDHPHRDRPFPPPLQLACFRITVP